MDPPYPPPPPSAKAAHKKHKESHKPTPRAHLTPRRLTFTFDDIPENIPNMPGKLTITEKPVCVNDVPTGKSHHLFVWEIDK